MVTAKIGSLTTSSRGFRRGPGLVIDASPSGTRHAPVAFISFLLGWTAVEGEGEGDGEPSCKDGGSVRARGQGRRQGKRSDAYHATAHQSSAAGLGCHAERGDDARPALSGGMGDDAGTRRRAGVAHPPAASRQPRAGRGDPGGTVVGSPSRLNLHSNLRVARHEIGGTQLHAGRGARAWPLDTIFSVGARYC